LSTATGSAGQSCKNGLSLSETIRVLVRPKASELLQLYPGEGMSPSDIRISKGRKSVHPCVLGDSAIEKTIAAVI
jgi:hypothetical protein